MIPFIQIPPESARRMWERHYDEHNMESTAYRHGLLTMEILDQCISDLEKGGDDQCRDTTSTKLH
jgi:hypothetical protein